MRTIRIMKLCFIFYGAVLILVVYRMPVRERQPVSISFQLMISLLALASLAFGFSGPRVIKKMAERSAGRGRRSAPEKQWMSRCVLSMAAFMACSLYGVVLHFTGAHVYDVVLLAAGLLALIVWRPEPAPGADDGTIQYF